jgi:CelD/BcsL family acetyltransferase involved in cellulose biosynthesis
MVLADLAADRALRTSVRPNFVAAGAWPARVPSAICIERTVHVLDLEGGMDTYWSKRLSGNGRQQLRAAERKAGRAGLEVGTGDEPEPVAAFYDLYLRWLDNRARERHLPPALIRSRGRRAEPLAKFEAVAASFPEACRIRVATAEGVPVAAVIVLVHGSVCVYWRGVSDKRVAGPLHANQLLQLRAIEQACEAGCRYYEMGESGGVRSLEDFKYRLGARERQLTEYRLERVPFTWFEDRLDGVRGAVASRLAGRRG